MAKKATKRRKPAKKKTDLAKRGKPKNSEILATMIRDGKKVNIEKWHIAGICVLPVCISGADELSKEQKARFELKFEAVKIALCSDSKKLQDTVVDTILGDLVAGAYQDKLIAYTRIPVGDRQNSLDALSGIQRVRQSADTHLLNIIKAVRDIKRPPVNVVVKQAEQVNVAEQINQGDKQVNIAPKSDSNDLDTLL